MKKIAIAAALVLSGFAVQAQTKDVVKETKTTTVKVNDGSGEKKLVKTENRNAVNEIEIKDGDSKGLNKDIQYTPAQVSSSTSISADSGFNEKIGQISNFQMNGQNYFFVTDKTGYRIATSDNKEMGRLRKTSNNNYIFRTKDATSVGHFDASGNFVVETYDDKTDGITVQTYTRTKQ